MNVDEKPLVYVEDAQTSSFKVHPDKRSVSPRPHTTSSTNINAYHKIPIGDRLFPHTRKW